MLEQLISGGLPSLSNPFGGWQGPQDFTYLLLLLSAISTLILTRFSDGTRIVFIPVAFGLLWFSGNFFNSAFHGVQFTGLGDMSRMSVLTVLGHIAAGPLLLACFNGG